MGRWLFFGDFVRLHILYHVARKPICRVEIVAELDRHGYRLNAAKLNSVLYALEQAGLLTACTVFVSGKRRKYYEATATGLQVMESAKKKLHELAAEMLQRSPSAKDLRENKPHSLE